MHTLARENLPCSIVVFNAKINEPLCCHCAVDSNVSSLTMASPASARTSSSAVAVPLSPESVNAGTQDLKRGPSVLSCTVIREFSHCTRHGTEVSSRRVLYKLKGLHESVMQRAKQARRVNAPGLSNPT